MRKTFIFLLFTGIAFQFLVGCAKMDTAGIPTPGNDNTKDDKPIDADNMACYSGKCYPTISKANLIDPNKDFVYPNPSTFPRKEQRKQYSAPLHLLDLKNINPNDRVAANFKLGDFLSASKGRYGVFSISVVEKVQKIRDEIRLPVFINSGYRSPGYNRRTDGSAKWSRHTYGDAVDFKVAEKTPEELAKYCTNQNSSFYLVYKTHIHCDWRNDTLDPVFYGTSTKIHSQNLIQTLETNILKTENASRFQFTEDDDYRYLTIQVPHDTEEGDLIHSWYITLPNGEVIESNDTKVALPKISGTFRVEALVGGILQFDENLVW